VVLSDPGRVARRNLWIVRAGAWLFGLFPLGLLAYRWSDRGLGANPIEALILHFGRWAIVLLLAALAITPLRRLTRFNALVKARRTLGLFGFTYVALHFLTYLVLDQFFAWEYIWEDIAERPFITVGFLAFLFLIPLAVTSTKGWIRRLGRNWVRLHRLFYVAMVLAVVHYFWNVRGEQPTPLIAIGMVVLLLAARLPAVARRLSALRT
jgi:sulfoxide reductase heme-binding subunit YedZ